MLLIATDEAGYGPKLGPLVVTATMWRLPDQGQPSYEDLFAPLRQPTSVGDVTVVIDDSKSVYQPGRDNPLALLHAAISVCNRWIDAKEKKFEFAEFLETVAADDFHWISETPWLRNFTGMPFLSSKETAETLSTWSSTGISCQRMIARVIPAKAFNQACGDGMNKADLLSESTLGLVRQFVEAHAADGESIDVYCDRHGGRRYYAGVLQHVFHDATVQVVSEAKQQSMYRLRSDRFDAKIHFTVKGDTFTPVAMSSMYAKYIRERMMQSLNAYFAERHQASTPLKATAGYPSDASRFLELVQPIIDREQIAIEDLVRQR